MDGQAILQRVLCRICQTELECKENEWKVEGETQTVRFRSRNKNTAVIAVFFCAMFTSRQDPPAPRRSLHDPQVSQTYRAWRTVPSRAYHAFLRIGRR